MADSTASYTNIEDQLLVYNQQAMELLRNRNFVIALTYLTKAEQLLTQCNEFENRFTLESITWNNLGCFYKRTYKPSLALHYLKKALNSQEKCKAELVSIAGTHLNLCTIYSYMNSHDSAIKHALRALQMLESEPARNTNHVTTLVIAYYNAGVELELLAQISKALQMYDRGLDLATSHLGKNHELTSSLKKNYSKLASKSDSKSSSSRVSTRSSGRSHQTNHSFDHLSLSPKPTHRLPSLPSKKKPKKSSKNSLRSTMDNSLTDYSLQNSREWEPNEYNLSKYKESSKNHQHRKAASAVSPVKAVKLRENALTAPAARSLRENENVKVYILQKHRVYRDTPRSIVNSPQKPIRLSAMVSPYSHRFTPQNAAVKIQKAWRDYSKKQLILKKRVQGDPFLVMKTAINELDKLKKMHMDEKSLIGLPPLPVNISTGPSKHVLMSKELRMSKPKTCLESIPEVKRESKLDKIICIQSHIRGLLTRLRSKREKLAAIQIQTYVRMWQTSNLYHDIQAAVVHIQKTWRAWKRKKVTRSEV